MPVNVCVPVWVACGSATSITIRFVMFIIVIVIIIIIKSTRLTINQRKGVQRGKARGAPWTPFGESIECYKWLKNLWALRSHDRHPAPFLSLSRVTLCLTLPRGVAHVQRVHNTFPLIPSPSLSLLFDLYKICSIFCVFYAFSSLFGFGFCVFCLRRGRVIGYISGRCQAQL